MFFLSCCCCCCCWYNFLRTPYFSNTSTSKTSSGGSVSICYFPCARQTTAALRPFGCLFFALFLFRGCVCGFFYHLIANVHCALTSWHILVHRPHWELQWALVGGFRFLFVPSIFCLPFSPAYLFAHRLMIGHSQQWEGVEEKKEQQNQPITTQLMIMLMMMIMLAMGQGFHYHSFLSFCFSVSVANPG